jgi:hypothetical protein
MTDKIELTGNCLLHSLILFTILTFAFWYLISKLSKKVITEEITHNMSNVVKKGLDNIPSDLQYVVKKNISKYESYIDKAEKLFDKEDKVVSKNNSWTITVNIISMFFIFLLFFVFLFSLVISQSTGTPEMVKHIFIENIILFSFIGVVEVGFFLLIGKKFIPTPPSAISKTAIEYLKQKF